MSERIFLGLRLAEGVAVEEARRASGLDAAAFSRPAVDVFGTAPRYINTRGPGIRTLDFALLKSWRTVVEQRFEFRLEANNATNTPIFSDPNSTFGDAKRNPLTW